MSNNQTTIPPPPTTDEVGGGDWDDNHFLHFTPRKPEGGKENFTLCGIEGDYNKVADVTPEQLKTMPICPVCVALAKYDGRWRLE